VEVNLRTEIYKYSLAEEYYILGYDLL